MMFKRIKTQTKRLLDCIIAIIWSFFNTCYYLPRNMDFWWKTDEKKQEQLNVLKYFITVIIVATVVFVFISFTIFMSLFKIKLNYKQKYLSLRYFYFN